MAVVAFDTLNFAKKLEKIVFQQSKPLFWWSCRENLWLK
jgi:hypothetical protein